MPQEPPPQRIRSPDRRNDRRGPADPAGGDSGRRPGNDLFRRLHDDGGGIVDELRRKGRYRLFDGVDYTLPPEERIEIRRQGLLADLYISGINATTEEGALYWLDGIGNRVAAIAFGPRKVLLVAGRNKIVATRAAAEARIRDIAAPRNVARLGQKTPCAVTGVCADCDSEGRICNTHLRMERCFPRKRITVILIDEEMGL